VAWIQGCREIILQQIVMRLVILGALFNVNGILYAQQDSGAPTMDELEKQLTQKKQAKKVSDDARAAKAVSAAEQARAEAQRDAMTTMAARYRGRWQGQVDGRREHSGYFCYVTTIRSIQLDMNQVDTSKETIAGRMTVSVNVTAVFDPDNKISSTMPYVWKRESECESKGGSRSESSSIFLTLKSESPNIKSVNYIDEGCTGANCHSLDRGAFNMTLLDNGQAEVFLFGSTFRLSR
jgi:hypothetical protein